MVLTTRHKVIDRETGELQGRIFVEPDIYQEELAKIFGRAWLMIGHESLLPRPNDFMHTYIGEDPVILCRDGKGHLHAFLNRCTHRGNRICRVDDGHDKFFTCAYHGWIFSNEGKLEHVPGFQEAYYEELDRDQRALAEARVDTYAGIIFATWDKGAPTLEEYLGDTRWYLDTVFNRLDSGTEAYGPIKWLEPVNWKTPVDNCSDNYHVPLSHGSSAHLETLYLGRPRTTHDLQFKSPSKHVFVNGHALTFRMSQPGEVRRAHGVTKYNLHLFEEYYKDTQAEAEKRLGKQRAGHVQLANHSLFPNGVLGFRLALPRGPLQTEFWHFVVVERALPKELKKALAIGSVSNNGPAGLFEQDDLDNWRQVTEGSRTPLGRQYAQDLSMGIGHSSRDPQYPGLISERYISENNQRNFYRRWEEFMNADDWSDIPLDRPTATYEGTATMKTSQPEETSSDGPTDLG